MQFVPPSDVFSLSVKDNRWHGHEQRNNKFTIRSSIITIAPDEILFSQAHTYIHVVTTQWYVCSAPLTVRYIDSIVSGYTTDSNVRNLCSYCCRYGSGETSATCTAVTPFITPEKMKQQHRQQTDVAILKSKTRLNPTLTAVIPPVVVLYAPPLLYGM